MDGAAEADEVVGVLREEGEQEMPRKIVSSWDRMQKRRRSNLVIAPCRWKTPGEQRRYSSRILETLRCILRRNEPHPSSNDALRRKRAVREAADRALATAAGGSTRWSRAILSSCRTLKLRKKRRAVGPRFVRRRKAPPSPVAGADQEAGVTERRVRMLGRMVPGCRRLLLPSLLEEVTDYIAALEMQIRVMSVLAEVFSSPNGGSSSYHTFSQESHTPHPHPDGSR